MDFIVGLPNTSQKHDSIWVIVDRLTKTAHFIPVHTTYTAKKYAEIYLDRRGGTSMPAASRRVRRAPGSTVGHGGGGAAIGRAARFGGGGGHGEPDARERKEETRG